MAVGHGHTFALEQANQVIVTDVIKSEFNAHIALIHVVEILLAHKLIPNPEAAPVLEGWTKVRQSWHMAMCLQASNVMLFTYMNSLDAMLVLNCFQMLYNDRIARADLEGVLIDALAKE